MDSDNHEHDKDGNHINSESVHKHEDGSVHSNHTEVEHSQEEFKVGADIPSTKGEDHGHTHEAMDHPGHFAHRESPLDRNFKQRAFTVGIGGPVGSGVGMVRVVREARGDRGAIASWLLAGVFVGGAR